MSLIWAIRLNLKAKKQKQKSIYKEKEINSF